jgi:predicted dehydrogenase
MAEPISSPPDNPSAATTIRRREFIASSAATAGLMIVKPQLVRGTQANSAVRVGLLGCGQRGTAVATSFTNNTIARYVALADLFQDKLESGKAYFDNLNASKGAPAIDRRLMFRGPRAFEELAQSNAIDMVHIATTDYWHPDHLEAVVVAGKHVYCEKPVSVDVASTRRILEIGQRAQGRLSLDVGLQLRHAPPYVELMQRIHAGALGRIANIEAHYHATAITYPPLPNPNAGLAERRIRHFFWDKTLSGDIMVDQDIHALDICNWALQAHPIKAVGAGGRINRTDEGDCWDHFDVTYTYPDGTHLSFSSYQGGDALWDVGGRFFGARGVAEWHYTGVVGIYGEQPWEWEGSYIATAPGHASIYAIDKTGAADRVRGVFHDALEFADRDKDRAFIDSITSGNFHNQAALGVEAALTAILGRMAAYSGREATWDEMLQANEHYDSGIDLNQFA